MSQLVAQVRLVQLRCCKNSRRACFELQACVGGECGSVDILLPLSLQMYTDPDEIFQQHQKTCSLDAMFTQRGECAGNAG